MLVNKQIQVIFLFEFKMGCKAAETTCNLNDASGPGTAKERTEQCWFKFCKGDESLEDGRSGRALKAENNQLTSLPKLILLQPHKKLPKSSMPTILQSFSFWSQL